MIPEDSMLKRHYLTEQKYKLGSVSVESVAEIVETVEPEIEPLFSKGVMLPLIAFLFMMAIVFL